jgi:hypothetical protein
VFRNSYKTVTLPILIYSDQPEREGSTDFLPGFSGLRPVRVLRSSDLRQNSKFWQSLTEVEREEFLAVAQLVDAVTTKDRMAARSACQRLEKTKTHELAAIASQLAGRVTTYPQTKLHEFSTNRLTQARFVLWNFEGKSALAVFCPNNVTALYAKFLLSRESGAGFAVCPHCGDPFVPNRPNQVYCCGEHRDGHRVKRWRASRRVKAGKADK